MPKESAGLLLYRVSQRGLEVLLVHPGGPFWAKKDEGAWSVPKGELGAGEEPLAAAVREFEEETGTRPTGDAIALGTVQQAGGKRVQGWAMRGEFDPASLRSNTFSLEWPPGSGSDKSFPEVDRAAWLTLPEARRKILKGQLGLLEALEAHVRKTAP